MNTRPPLTLRDMLPTDTAAVAALEARLQFHPWSERQFIESLALNHPSWVVLQEEDLVGFAVTMRVLDEATLLEIGICPEQQRRGIGRELLQWVIDASTEAGMAVLHLEVRIGNTAARALYRKYGFIEVGRRRGYYQAPVTPLTPDGREDAILMALTLDEGAR